MDTIIKKISRKDQQMAQSSLSTIRSKVQKLKRAKRGSVNVRINNTDITIPNQALFLLSDILSDMAEGKPVSLLSAEPQMTTQEAADRLHVSRPFVVKLLETGEIPFLKVGSHRRILLKDILEYEQRQQDIRKKQLTFLSKQAQKLNLGY